MQVIVHHIGPACVQCNQTKRLMDQLGIEYDQIDLRQHPELTEKFKNLGHLTAPIVTAGEHIWSGFKYEQIKSLAARLRLERK